MVICQKMSGLEKMSDSVGISEQFKFQEYQRNQYLNKCSKHVTLYALVTVF